MAASDPLLISRYTVMLDTRISAATSPTVRRRSPTYGLLRGGDITRLPFGDSDVRHPCHISTNIQKTHNIINFNNLNERRRRYTSCSFVVKSKIRRRKITT